MLITSDDVAAEVVRLVNGALNSRSDRARFSWLRGIVGRCEYILHLRANGG